MIHGPSLDQRHTDHDSDEASAAHVMVKRSPYGILVAATVELTNDSPLPGLRRGQK